MEDPKTETPELSVLRQLNEITGARRGFRPIKSNITKISALFKAGFTEQDIIEVIQLKTVQWKNSPKMSGYLCPGTLFRESNFEKYINEVSHVKENPKLYAQHFAELNGIKPATGSAHSKINAMFGKGG